MRHSTNTGLIGCSYRDARSLHCLPERDGAGRGGPWHKFCHLKNSDEGR